MLKEKIKAIIISLVIGITGLILFIFLLDAIEKLPMKTQMHAASNSNAEQTGITKLEQEKINIQYEKEKELEDDRQNIKNSIYCQEAKLFMELYGTSRQSVKFNYFYRYNDTVYYLDFSDGDKRYWVKMSLSDTVDSNAIFNMPHSNLDSIEDEKLVTILAKYTNFSVSEYKLEDIDFSRLNRIRHYNGHVSVRFEEGQILIYISK